MRNMDGVEGMDWMMAGMGLVYVLALVLLVLGIAALAKYLFFSGRDHKGE